MNSAAQNRPVTIVTAASRGIGEATARMLAARGHRLILLARGDDVIELASELAGRAVIGSVTDPDALAECVALAATDFGGLDAVVNNTGHPAKGPLLEVTDEEWHAGVDLLLLNVVRMARLATPVMIEGRGGSIVNVSTLGAEEPNLAFPVSSALRAALSAYTKLYATEYAKRGIRMNNVLPGFVDSYPVDDATRDQIATGREGSVADVAATISFLISEDARYITGQNIRVDGGLGRSM